MYVWQGLFSPEGNKTFYTHWRWFDTLAKHDAAQFNIELDWKFTHFTRSLTESIATELLALLWTGFR